MSEEICFQKFGTNNTTLECKIDPLAYYELSEIFYGEKDKAISGLVLGKDSSDGINVSSFILQTINEESKGDIEHLLKHYNQMNGDSLTGM